MCISVCGGRGEEAEVWFGRERNLSLTIFHSIGQFSAIFFSIGFIIISFLLDLLELICFSYIFLQLINNTYYILYELQMFSPLT